ncbi:uncharacterized protein LOC116176608 isoform X2 [Photinus pyralis]|uniref:uncharacterized protein LOC116176608 isoform X2 n=1 Tax=Photinus pyralis TaxID=7054 RepID=UPI0012674D06|nr:uncharacterized protein LOC116176608 isoform X2 [Photinus pyralis]
MKNIIRLPIGTHQRDRGDNRLRLPPLLLIPILIYAGFIFYVDVFHLSWFQITTIGLPKPRFIGYRENSGSFVIKTEGCRMPYIDPFDSSIRRYIFTERKITCNKNKPPLMDANFTSIYLLHNSLGAYKVTNLSSLECCYSPFHRVDPSSNQDDSQISYSKCVYFNQSALITDEFVRVSCTFNKTEIYKDFFAFVPIKPNVANFSKSQFKKLNVLIIGLDSVSRLNFHRQMPNTAQTLQSIGAIEFLGYNKIADNTFPNLAPVLTGMTHKELVNTCWRKRSDRFDKCKFIWSNYSKSNYATAFAEDSVWMDYYWGSFDYAAEKQIGNDMALQAPQCVGSRPIYQTLLRYIQQFTQVMKQHSIPWFGLFWSSSLSHNFLNKPKLGDEAFVKLFKELERRGILQDTVLIYMSDHGMRWGPIRTTYQGRMEERLPFLFIALPKVYRETHHQASANLNRNSKRLTSPFDLHETLKDLLDPYSLSQEVLTARVLKRNGTHRGYSLFEPIPDNRTCATAGISSHWCTCQKSVAVNANSSIVNNATKFIVQYINNQLKGYAACAKLALFEISNAHLHTASDQLKGGTEDYTIVFRTRPGDGHFEATVRRNLRRKESPFEVVGTISRINLYGSQSVCITDFHLKLYCYCIN